MANIIEPGSSLANVIKVLDLSLVPEKLHCVACKQFLLNPYKTDCCDQSICETCFESDSAECPKCKHRPFGKEFCKPSKAARGTAKAYLKSYEKKMAEEEQKVTASENSSLEVINSNAVTNLHEAEESEEPSGNRSDAQEQLPNSTIHAEAVASDIQPSIETGADLEILQAQASEPQETVEELQQRQASISTNGDDDDDEVEIQVEPTEEDEYFQGPQVQYIQDDNFPFNKQDDEARSDKQEGGTDMSNAMDMSNFNMQNMGMNFGGNMDMQTMAMMQQMMMNGFSPMMGMPMGMNSNMFGNFGQNGGMNGINMGMNFPNQNMFGWNGQNNNSWQNNNGNAFSNGMANDFGSQYGFNMSQQGNFQQQPFHNGDFQNGFAGYRGRGRRGRGGFGRGRGYLNQYSHNSYQGNQASHEQEHMQQDTPAQPTSAITHDDTPEDTNNQGNNYKVEDTNSGDREKLMDAATNHESDDQHQPVVEEVKKERTPAADMIDQPSENENRLEKRESHAAEKQIPEAYHEDFESMAPPSAPSGPSGRFGDREYGFRRGHGRYASRGRGSFHPQNGYPVSPIRSVSQNSQTIQTSPGKSAGVEGAPTGPRAMREPPAPKPQPRPSSGLQIIGRASVQAQNPPDRDSQMRSPSPVNGHSDQRGRQSSRSERYEEQPRDDGSEASYARSDRDRRRKKSRRYDDDYDMQDTEQSYSRSGSQDRKPSHRSNRYEKGRDREKDKYSSKHRSSKRRRDDDAREDYHTDDYPSDNRDTKHRSSHRSSNKNSSRYDDRERNDRKRTREDDDDRHRKRSRHDRDRENDHIQDDDDDDDPYHRSRRHKKDHHSSSRRDRERERDRERQVGEDDLGLRITGRSTSNRKAPESTLPTPTSTTATSEPQKDPHTLEREARDRERMAKEKQRREKAALDKRGSTKSALSSRGNTVNGRRVSYKTEEVERGMYERDSARWR